MLKSDGLEALWGSNIAASDSFHILLPLDTEGESFLLFPSSAPRLAASLSAFISSPSCRPLIQLELDRSWMLPAGGESLRGGGVMIMQQQKCSVYPLSSALFKDFSPSLLKSSQNFYSNFVFVWMLGDEKTWKDEGNKKGRADFLKIY